MSRWARRVWVGLGLLVGAVLHSTAHGQGTTAVDSQRTVIDTTSIHVKAQPTDTLLPPLARAEMGGPLHADSALHWDRAALNAMDALTLGDLLAHVPGVTTFTAGWIAAPSGAACWSWVRCVRVFQDGIEMDELDPRASGVLDLTQVQLWAAEEVSVEQTGNEIRVNIRTWRVDRTTPYTQTDIATGDQNTNLYRFFFGRGFHDGLRIQLGAQQFGTTPPTYLGTSSDQTSILGRIGWAGTNGLRLDGFFLTSLVHRGSFTAIQTLGAPTGDSIPTLDASRRVDYLRAGLGDPDTSRRWIQLMASQTEYSFNGEPDSTTIADSLPTDTILRRRQYVASAGVNALGASLSFTERLRTGAGPSVSTPSVRVRYDLGRVQLTGFAEGFGPDSLSHSGAAGEIDPFNWLRFSASVGHIQGRHNADTTVALDSLSTTNFLDTAVTTQTATSVQGVVGVRVHDLWLSAGVVHHDALVTGTPTVFNPAFAPSVDGAATGAIASIQGRVNGPFYIDATAIRWDDTLGLYRPQYQARAQVMLKTNLIHRFPTNNFGLQASAIYEYRSGMAYPFADSVAETSGYRVFSTLLEVRILSAVLTWRFTNTIGEKYFQVPGYLMPRISSFYGVRWAFWN